MTRMGSPPGPGRFAQVRVRLFSESGFFFQARHNADRRLGRAFFKLTELRACFTGPLTVTLHHMLLFENCHKASQQLD